MSRSPGLGILWAIIAVLTAAPLWLTLPVPDDAIAITDAVQVLPDGEQYQALPRTRQPAGSTAHYRMRFDLHDTSQQYLFIPVLSQRATISLNGTPIEDTDNRTTLIGLSSGISALTALPPKILREENNVLDVQLQSVGLIPAYLSQLYIGTSEQLSGHYRLRVFVLEYLKLMVPAGQLLIALVVLVVWLYRPRDPLFGWLTLLLMLSMIIYIGMMRDLIPHLVELIPYLAMAGSSAAIIMIIVVLLIAGRDPPRWLQWMPLTVPAAFILLALTQLVPAKTLVILASAPLNLLSLLASLGILVWATLRDRLEETTMLLLPMLMALVAGLHDFAMVLSLVDGPVFLSVYYRPLLLIGFAMILMRRLGISLTRLDNVNLYLTDKLNEREQELARLHAEEKNKAAQQIRSEERQRLTRDLHDGLSGHLVSIIALSEQQRSTNIEDSAREALDDLRLVIHSLDIRDDELPLALSGLRERLERQLKRLGITLDWSIARLPDISNVSPTQALNLLRILQEAVTNAIKHAKPSLIRVHGSQLDDGQPVIVVENDGRPFPHHAERGGRGLGNMRRRIRQLGGEIEIELLETGTRMRVLLPLRLPDVWQQRLMGGE